MSTTLGPLPPLIESDALFSDIEVNGGMNVETNGAVGFFGVGPILQVSTNVATITRVSIGSNTVTDQSTFNGYTVGQVVTALQSYGLLATI